MSKTFFQESRVTEEGLLGVHPCWVDYHINDWREKAKIYHPVGDVKFCRRARVPAPKQPVVLASGWSWLLLGDMTLSGGCMLRPTASVCALIHNWFRDCNKYLTMFIQLMGFGDLAFTKTPQKEVWYLVACCL